MSKRERANTAIDGVTQARGAGPKWTQEEAIAYERACDYLGEVLGIYSGELDAEEARGMPRQDRVTWLETEIARLGKVRRRLKVTDHESMKETTYEQAKGEHQFN